MPDYLGEDMKKEKPQGEEKEEEIRGRSTDGTRSLTKSDPITNLYTSRQSSDLADDL